jgi:LmbE family N-acetylglucosaminyl deacetylase
MRLKLGEVSRVVVLGAHCDDIEIAAGGLLLSLASAFPGVRVHYVVCAGSVARQAEAVTAATGFLPGAKLSFSLNELPDGRLPAHWAQVKEVIEEAASTVDAQLVLSPWRGDAHQDHRLLGELAPTAFRNAQHLQYEIPKWDGDLGRPNFYVPLTTAQAQRKVELLNKCFPSQHGRDWWSDETFLSLMKLRGIECRAPYAEAFHVNKTVVQL